MTAEDRRVEDAYREGYQHGYNDAEYGNKRDPDRTGVLMSYGPRTKIILRKLTDAQKKTDSRNRLLARQAAIDRSL